MDRWSVKLTIHLSIYLAIVVCIAASAQAASILPSDRDASANWRMAGLLSQGGIPNRTTQCGSTLSPKGGGLDDTSAIQAAITACTAGQVVKLAAGTFTIGEGNTINLSKGVSLRGAGAGTTLLSRTNGATWNSYFPGSNPGPLVRLGGAGNGTTVNLAADGQQGSVSVQVQSAAGLQVGQIVLIDEASGAGWQPERIGAWASAHGQVWAAPDYRVVWTKHNPAYQYVDDFDAATSPSQPNSAGCWFSNCDRPTNEMHQISAISGTTITFDSPLMISYRVSNQAKLYPYTNMVQKAGLEDLTVSGGDNGNVAFNSCAYCWAQNVENTFWLGHGFNIDSSFRPQLEGIYVHNAAWPVNGGGGYAIAFEWGSSEALIENSVSMLANKVMVANSAGSGSVIAYNYMDDAYINGQDWVEVGLNASHMVGPHHVLFEGNYSFNFDSDQTHGNSIYMTIFRNHLSGYRRAFTTLNGTSVNDANLGPLRAAAAHAYAYWFSFIGNVLGTPGKMSGWTYNCVNGTNQIVSPCVWNLGWVDITPQGNDPNVALTTIRDGNYDYLNNAQKWITTPAGYSIPNSLYISSKPAFFGSAVWPWVDPVSGATSTLPAKACFEQGKMPNCMASGTSTGSACDVNQDNSTTVLDVQQCVNQAIGAAACATGDINKDGACNVVDVQRTVNAALGGQCVTQ
jgi:hypothetical protein